MANVVKVLTPAIALEEFNSIQALAGLDDWARLQVPWEIASEDRDEVPLLFLIHHIRACVGADPSQYEDTPYARILVYLENLFNEEYGL